MDFSDYNSKHPNYNLTNKKVLSKCKDEFNGKPIAEYIGLKPKKKAIKGDDGKVEKTAKGVSKNKVKTHITFDKYKNKTLYENYKEYIPSNAVRSKKHQITTLTVNKLGLSNFERISGFFYIFFLKYVFILNYYHCSKTPILPLKYYIFTAYKYCSCCCILTTHQYETLMKTLKISM